MSTLVRRPATYLALPMLLNCALTLLTYSLPGGYADGIALLAIAAAATCVLDARLRIQLPAVERFRAYRYAGTRDAFLVMALAAVVTVFCIVDVALFPIPLFSDPSSYATLSPLRAHVRHISTCAGSCRRSRCCACAIAGYARRWWCWDSCSRSW